MGLSPDRSGQKASKRTDQVGSSEIFGDRSRRVDLPGGKVLHIPWNYRRFEDSDRGFSHDQSRLELDTWTETEQVTVYMGEVYRGPLGNVNLEDRPTVISYKSYCVFNKHHQ